MNLNNFLSQFQFMTSDKPNLNAMNWFMKNLDYPNKKLKFIHVAGTNGKGSICEMLSKILISANYTVGKYISPYLITANEAICINNKYFSNEDEEYYIPLIENLVKKYELEFNISPSRFEVETALALIYFLEKKCDIVILEVGLGGKYDCTNIIESPIVSCFGSISYDHTNILGNTLEKISNEKAGIIKENSNSVIFEQNNEVLSIIEKICKEKNNNLVICQNKDIKNYSITNIKNFKKESIKQSNFKNQNFDNSNNLSKHYSNQIYQKFDYKTYKNIELNLQGKIQIQNASVVLETINILKQYGFDILEEQIKNSLKNIIHPARFEIVSKNPLTIFDGAHNANALDNFIDTVKTLFPNEKYTFVISQITTKDYQLFLKTILTAFEDSTFILTGGTDKNKFFDKEVLYDFAKNITSTNTIVKSDFSEALSKLEKNINFIIGSFYVYKETLFIFNNKKTKL